MARPPRWRSIAPGCRGRAFALRDFHGGKDSETSCHSPPEGMCAVDLPLRRDVGHTQPGTARIRPREPGLPGWSLSSLGSVNLS